MIICVTVASLISFWLITLYAGKPISKDLPTDIIVYGQAIDIKNKKIYILYKNTNGELPPTLIEIEYSKSLKGSLKEGMEQSKGKPFRMKKRGDGDGQNGDGDGESQEDGEGNQGAMSQESETWDIGPLPPPILPDKTR
jgi:hypothetical protein|tara:strand:- start:699 stop:1115 length:417 start_codon:yes stop_codon:yes gene_type:complete